MTIIDTAPVTGAQTFTGLAQLVHAPGEVSTNVDLRGSGLRELREHLKATYGFAFSPSVRRFGGPGWYVRRARVAEIDRAAFDSIALLLLEWGFDVMAMYGAEVTVYPADPEAKARLAELGPKPLSDEPLDLATEARGVIIQPGQGQEGVGWQGVLYDPDRDLKDTRRMLEADLHQAQRAGQIAEGVGVKVRRERGTLVVYLAAEAGPDGRAAAEVARKLAFRYVLVTPGSQDLTPGVEVRRVAPAAVRFTADQF